MSEDDQRKTAARNDRYRWYKATHVSGGRGIISPRDGREVARFGAEADRDSVLAVVRSENALASIVERLIDAFRGEGLSEASQMALMNDAEMVLRTRP